MEYRLLTLNLGGISQWQSAARRLPQPRGQGV
jgi:hypothetical protein